MKTTYALLAAVAAACAVVVRADTVSRAADTFFFLGPWKVQEVKDGVVRQLQLNFTAGADEWTMQSPVRLDDESASQVGLVTVRAGDAGVASLWATPGLLLGDAAQSAEAEVDVDATGEASGTSPSDSTALLHVMDFSWLPVHVGAEADKEGSHLAAAASGPLAAATGAFHMQRRPTGSKHGVEGAAAHHSDVGDILALTVAAAGGSHTQWLAVRVRDPSSATFWQTYQWWIMGAIFVANLGLRSWARGRGRGDAGAAPTAPSMQEARAARRSKGKGKTS